MSKAIEALRRILDGHNWGYEVVSGSAIRGAVGGECGRWTWCAAARPGDDFLHFHSFVPMNIPLARRAAVAEFITRANYALRFGHFDMDWSDGEVSFQTTLALDRRRPPATSQLDHLVRANCWSMEHYLPALMSVVYGDVPAVLAIARADAPADADGVPVQPPEVELDRPTPSRPLRRFLPGDN